MPERPAILLAIAAGSGLGGLLRVAVTGHPDQAFPWALGLVNSIGCFLIAFYHELTRPGGRLYHPPVVRQFVMSGLMGGFTSYSLIALEALRLALARDSAAVLLFLALSGASWVLAAYLGRTVARGLMHGPGGWE